MSAAVAKEIAPTDGNDASLCEPTAALVADYVCEFFSLRNKLLSETLDPNATVHAIATGDLLHTNAQLLAHFQDGPRWKSQPALRLFLESSKSSVPTYAMDFYAPGESPGLNGDGLTRGSQLSSTIVLYKVSFKPASHLQAH